MGVVDVTRAAADVVIAASPRNPTPAPGSEYLLVNVSLECITPEEDQCDVSHGVQFHVIDSAGASYEEVGEPLAIPNPFRLSQLTGGAIAQGNIAFIVPIAENGLVMEFTWVDMTGVYLGIE